MVTEITRASPPYGQGTLRSEDDEGHHPLGVIVITEMIENEASAQGLTIDYQIPERPSSELLPHPASAGEVSLSVSPVLSPYRKYVRLDLLTNPSACRTSVVQRDQTVPSERYSQAIKM